ncbi:MAG: hypothetical protein U9O98_08960 [Asgard group archaeon]|nr:hypothetical protein [Asgard group archaeon]
MAYANSTDMFNFSSRKIIATQNLLPTDALLMKIFVTKQDIVSFLWVTQLKNSSHLKFSEKLLNESITSPVIINAPKKGLTIKSISITENLYSSLYIFWTVNNMWDNRSYILYNVKSSKVWRGINRLTGLNSYYYDPAVILEKSGNLRLIYCMIEHSSSNSYSSGYFHKIFQSTYSITINQYNISTFHVSSSGEITLSLTNIQPYSNYSALGILNDPTEVTFHKYGIWRKGEGFPCCTGELILDSSSGTWYANVLIENSKPGEYYAIIAFKDNIGVYSNHWSSSNSYEILPKFDINEPTKPKVGLWLGIGIPVGVVIVLTPIIVFIYKKKQKN